MAIGWIYFKFLEQRGIFSGGKKKILDVGAQNIFDIPVADGVDFLRRYGSKREEQALRTHVEEMSRRAIWPPKKAGLFLREFLEDSHLDYTGFDIFPGPKVEIFDLNYQSLAQHHREAYDIVFNFGTTEHVFNQFNCFKVMHEAARPGAYIFHQLPCTGWMDHGYWVYSPRTFVELAEANDYEVCDLWCSGPLGTYSLLDRLTYAPGARDQRLPQNMIDSWDKLTIVDGLVNVLLKKRSSGPFKLGLDITTSAGGPDESIMETYFAPSSSGDTKGRRSSMLRLFTAREIGEEFFYRIRRKLGLTK
jgi:hypothetical protein